MDGGGVWVLVGGGVQKHSQGMDRCVAEQEYRVSRPVYTNPALDRRGERQTRPEKSFKQRLADKCGSCSSSRALKAFRGLFPVFDWLSRYPIREWLAGDVIAGVSTGLVCSLQGLAYGLLVSVAPVYGLYSAFFPLLTYFLMGTSRHISVGPFPVTCLMVGSVVLTLAPDDHFLLPANETAEGNASGGAVGVSHVDVEAMEDRRIAVAATMTVLVGLIQVALGCLQVGFLVRYLSDPLVGGFTTAAAVHVLVSQLKTVLSVPGSGSHSGTFSIFYTLLDVASNVRQSNAADLVAGLLTVAVVMVVKEINTRYQHRMPVPIPIEVIVTAAAACLSYAVDLNARYGANIVRSIPRGFAAPRPPDTGLFSELLGPSFSTAVVSYAVAVSSVLAGVVIANLKGMFLQVAQVPRLWRQSPADCFTWLATCGACVLLGLDAGLLAGLLFQLGTVVLRTQFPTCSTLGNIAGTDLYRDVQDYKHIAEVPGVKIFRCSAPLYFANVDYFKERLRVAVGFDAVRVFKKRNKALRKIHKLLGEGKLKATETGLVNGQRSPGLENKGFESDQDDGGRGLELELPVDWTRELPVEVSVPRVDIHSLVLDFSAVSFLDVVAVKSLRLPCHAGTSGWRPERCRIIGKVSLKMSLLSRTGCRCSARRAKSTALSLLPIIGWVRIYQVKEWLLSDLVSGVSTGLVAVLQDEGPPMNITGFEGLTRDDQRVLVASSASFMVGLMQLGMGLLQVGFVVMYLSDTLVSGFTTAAAVHILVSQLKFVLGLVVPGFSGPLAIVHTLEKIFVQITSTNICDLVTSLIIIAVVFVVKEINDRYKAKLPVPIPIEVIMETAVEAFPMAIVGFAVAFSVAKVYSVKHDYTIDGNQELIAFGVSNIFAASFKSFAASTALSRSAVQESTGGKTQLAGLLSAIIVMIVTLAIGFLLEPLPRSVLGAVVIVNLKGMLMQVMEVPYLWRRDKPDCVVWLVTCLASILLGLDIGLAVGLGIELITVVFRTQLYARRTLLLLNPLISFQIDEPEGVKIFRIPSPIFFANIDFFKTKLIEAIGFSPLRVLRKRNKALRSIRKLLKKGDMKWTTAMTTSQRGRTEDSEVEGSGAEDLDRPVDLKNLPIQIDWNGPLPDNVSVPRVDLHSLVLDFSAVSFLDISGLKGLKTMLKELIRVDVEVYIVACDIYVQEKLHACNFFDDEVRASIFYPTLHDAVLSILQKHPEASEKRGTPHEHHGGLTRDDQRVLVASSASFMVGLMQLGMGLLQVGFVVMYLSDTLVSGFTTAAAVHILVSQLKFVLGLVVPGFSGPLAIVHTLEKIFVQITSTNICDLVTSLIIIAVVFVVKEINDRYKAKLPVPIPIEVIMETAVEAFPMAIVGFAVAFSVAKVYSVKHDYTIDGNQVSHDRATGRVAGHAGSRGGRRRPSQEELIAFGVSNIFAASFKSFAASTALSRSAVQESTGGKTQLAGLLSAIIVMIVTLAIGFLLEPLPRSVLGAVVIVNLKGMLMQVMEVPYLWRRDKPDCVVWLVTCLASILLGLDIGLAVGLGIELITVVFRTQFPRCSVLANISGTDIYRDRKDYLDIDEPEGVKIFRIPSPIFFANIDFFKTKLIEAIGFSPLRVLRKRNKALRSIRKLLKKGDMKWTTAMTTSQRGRTEDSEVEGSGAEDLDRPVDLKNLPIQIDWNGPLPDNVSVPRVDLHSLVLDFSAVSFLDISGLKGLKTMLKELIRVDVEVYIVACDIYVQEKLHACNFFDDEVRTSIFYPTLHDAVLSILQKHPEASEKSGHLEKTPEPETKL
ncbi:LOW QUALITY PROTEIN: hypothetical protein CRUP_019053 [Coryphaenoides rupestris]|nr:LOW QUALITY PROTEIN: hypothetical protein CRUP_019053 [Coryphaenoides rupestris]